jgi:hypothetical protein
LRIIISPVIGDVESSLFCEGDIVIIDVKSFGTLLIEADSIDIPVPIPRYLGFTGPFGPLNLISAIDLVVLNVRIFTLVPVEPIVIPVGGELITTLLSDPRLQFITNSFAVAVVVLAAVVVGADVVVRAAVVVGADVVIGNRPRIILAASSIDIL